MKTMRLVDGLFLLGTLLGLPAGFYAAHYKYIDNQKAAGMLSEESTVDDFAKAQYLYADPQSARTALAYAITIHQDMQTENPQSGTAEKVNLGWCYAELSLLEESLGNTDVAKKQMAQAVQILQGAGLRDTTEFSIRQKLQKKIHENPPPDATPTQPSGEKLP